VRTSGLGSTQFNEISSILDYSTILLDHHDTRC